MNEELFKQAKDACMAITEAYGEKPDVVLWDDGGMISLVYGGEAIDVCKFAFVEEGEDIQLGVEALGCGTVNYICDFEQYYHDWRFKGWPPAQKGVGNLIFRVGIVKPSNEDDDDDYYDETESPLYQFCEKIDAMLPQNKADVFSHVSISGYTGSDLVSLSLRWTCPYEDEDMQNTFNQNAQSLLIKLVDAGFEVAYANFGHTKDSINLYAPNSRPLPPAFFMRVTLTNTCSRFTDKDCEWVENEFRNSKNEHIRNFKIHHSKLEQTDESYLQISFQNPCGCDAEQAARFCEECCEILRTIDAKFQFSDIGGSFGVSTYYVMKAKKRILSPEHTVDLYFTLLRQNMWTLPAH